MKEKELINSFSHFLISQKDFLQDCLSYNYGFTSKKGNVSYIDLIIFDDNIVNQPLAIVEFKINIPAEGATTERTKELLNYVGEIDVPAYLICPSENDFWIYELTDGIWQRLEKSNFPDFKALKGIFAAKAKLKGFQDAKKAKEKARKLQRKKAYTSLFSIIIAIVGGLITTIAISGIFSTKNESRPSDKDFVQRIESLEERVRANQKYSVLFSNQLAEMLAAGDSLKDSNQSNNYYHRKLLKINQSVDLIKADNSNLKTELEQLKHTISKDPLYLIELSTIRTDIVLLEKELDSDINIIKSELKSTDEKYNFLIGGIVTLIISILVLAVPNLIQGIKNTKVNSGS
ncbi:hypothetical protein [Marinifilum sp. D737]|uniref:hypothetical protein n=1 Tax=Marinifilum sp. D737 TaxID=2969628 RepID=UPI002276A9FC|nr:hypothetical protein [Marinifilum sp. D737]MCY1636707.1 hypothetical protein [Marinifilum sp. D737]